MVAFKNVCKFLTKPHEYKVDHMKVKVDFFILLIIVLLFTGRLFAAQDIPVHFTYPSFTGDFYVSGNVYFPPGVVKSKDDVIVKSHKSGEEVPTKIAVLRRWPDGSVLSAEIIFVANAARKQDYVLLYGDGIQRRKNFTETAVLPTISFSVAGVPKISEKVNVDVGQINVRVDRSHDIHYYWHIIPIVILITLSYYRYRKTNKIS